MGRSLRQAITGSFWSVPTSAQLRFYPPISAARSGPATALEAGKHVFCEKPLAITVEGRNRVLKAWRKSGKHLMVGFNMRYMHIFRRMKEIVDSGAIGEIKAVWMRHFVGHSGEFYFHGWEALRKSITSLLSQKAPHDFDVIHRISNS